MILQYTFYGADGNDAAASDTNTTNRVRFANKFVRTKGFVEEQAARRALYRTPFTRGAADGSWLFNPLDMSLKNVANTGALTWNGELYALYESGRPHALGRAADDGRALRCA